MLACGMAFWWCGAACLRLFRRLGARFVVVPTLMNIDVPAAPGFPLSCWSSPILANWVVFPLHAWPEGCGPAWLVLVVDSRVGTYLSARGLTCVLMRGSQRVQVADVGFSLQLPAPPSLPKPPGVAGNTPFVPPCRQEVVVLVLCAACLL